MSNEQLESRWRSRPVRVALVVTVLLLVGASVYSDRALYGTIRRAGAMQRESERRPYLLGELATDLALLHAKELDLLTEAPPEQALINGQIGELDKALSATIREVDSAVTVADRARWQHVNEEVALFRGSLAIAHDLTMRGDKAAAETSLDRVTDQAAHLFGDISRYSRVQQQEADLSYDQADLQLNFARRLILAVSLVASGLVIALWTLIISTLRKQRRLADSYLDKIEQSNRDLDAFAGRIAHDLRNALSPIRLHVQSLGRQRERGHFDEHGLVRIERAVGKAITLLDGLLAFSRVADMPSLFDASRVEDELDEVLAELAPQVAQVEASVRLDTEGDCLVACSPALLHTLLFNIVGNAIKFIERCPVRLITVKTRRDADFVHIEVTDSGPGIAKTELDRVFEPFYRVQGTNTKGHGIGLATVHRIVAACRGHIEVSSTLGEGTSFHIRLLAREAPALSSKENVEDRTPRKKSEPLVNQA